jgi:hypothetical protein
MKYVGAFLQRSKTVKQKKCNIVGIERERDNIELNLIERGEKHQNMLTHAEYFPGGRKGAAVLCELLPQELGYQTQSSYPDPRGESNRNPSFRAGQQPDGGYPNYPSQRSNF